MFNPLNWEGHRKMSGSSKIIKRAYYNPIISRLFHTSVYCLNRELSQNDCILDLGCGADSPVKFSKVKYSVGVEGFQPSLEQSKSKLIHDDYLNGDLRFLNFKERSFDVVILIEVLEHLSEKDGNLLLQKAEVWARRKVIMSTPNGYLPQSDIDGNVYFKHLSGWGIAQMKLRGYLAYGMAGLKSLRKENNYVDQHDTGVLSTVRFRPKLFWLIISELSQIITYYLPELAFEVFYVKRFGVDDKW